MRAVLRSIDAILNRHTMYRMVLYGFIVLLVSGEVLALTGSLSISAIGLPIAIGVLCTVCYATNWLLARWFHAAANSESWLITALILTLILPPPATVSRGAFMAATALIAMASKYLLRYRGSHIANPAAIAIFVMSVGGWLPATWWVAAPPMAAIASIVALAVLRKQRMFSLFFVFAASAIAMLLFVSSGLHHQAIADVLKNAVLSWPIIFMGSIMLTEPSTLPATRYYQLLMAVLVGAVFSSQLHIGRVPATPQAALLIGNLFTVLFAPAYGAMLRLKHIQQLTADIYELVFERPARGFAFAAGQYMQWTLPHMHVDSRGNRRIFSIASAPSEPDVRIGFRHYEPSSSFKTALLNLKPGQHIRASHIAGNFTLPSSAAPLLFIAGGIGVTPIRSMLQQCIATGRQLDAVVLYFAAKADDFVYQDVLSRAANIGVRTEYIIGRPDVEAIRSYVSDVTQRTAYLSGPDALVSGCKSMLRELSVPSTHIKTDHFTGY
jgi:ferredoxin-NADP reductase